MLVATQRGLNGQLFGLLQHLLAEFVVGNMHSGLPVGGGALHKPVDGNLRSTRDRFSSRLPWMGNVHSKTLG